MFCFVLVMQATTSPLAAQVTPEWLQQCAAAITSQLQDDAAPHWHDADGAMVRVASGPADIQAGEVPLVIVDELPDAPGAIALHDVQGNAVPVAFLALSTCFSLADVSTAISHELLETIGDPECNRWADAGNGFEYALELCDAVESTTYDLGNVTVSDFVLPDFFGVSGAPGPYSFVGSEGGAQPAAPFETTSGGYQIRREVVGGEAQVTGKVMHHVTKRMHWSSRTHRRGVRLHPTRTLQTGEV